MRSISGEGRDRNSQASRQAPSSRLSPRMRGERGRRAATATDPRALLVHCAEEMRHLARFLPTRDAEFRLHD